jgi:hypothetical protein
MDNRTPRQLETMNNVNALPALNEKSKDTKPLDIRKNPDS